MAQVSDSPKRALWRRVCTTIGGVVALLLFILILGDIRRRSVPLQDATWYAQQLAAKVGELNVLPTNLEVQATAGREARVKRFTWLTREEARTLRNQEGPVMVVYSGPIRRVLAADGRVAVLYDDGSFSSVWLTESEFDAQREHVEQAIEQGRMKGATDSPDGR